MIVYPAPIGGLVLLLVLVWVILEMRKNTAKERKARRKANRAAQCDQMQAIKENYRKIRIEDKIALLSIIVVFVLAALALWFFLG